MSQQRIAPCPVCKKPAAPLGRNTSFPFCSDRCRRVDLGRWFGEEYRVPSRPPEGDDSQPPADDSNER
ncbi:MAG TPA: DNA gyrase inhibitor YacG [Myxococcaceae bacterium]|nr:DNA gyrase inhibitor YacG [Myxococcaceae bacterium]